MIGKCCSIGHITGASNHGMQNSDQRENKWCHSVICAIPNPSPPMIPMQKFLGSGTRDPDLPNSIFPFHAHYSPPLRNHLGDAIWDSASPLWWRGWRPLPCQSLLKGAGAPLSGCEVLRGINQRWFGYTRNILETGIKTS